MVGDSGGMPGMELVSPCNMSLATRNFMSKHHLIEDFKNENNPSLGASPRLSSNNRFVEFTCFLQAFVEVIVDAEYFWTFDFITL